MTDALAPDRRLAIVHAPPAKRAALLALFALDDRLAAIVRQTHEPMIGQMRLTWWHDALTRLDTDAAPAEPVLRALQAEVLPLGATGQALAALTEGWEEMIVAEPFDAAAMERHAAARGGGLFAIAGGLLGGESPLLAPAGRAWALSDVAANLSDRKQADLAATLADEALRQAFSARWPRVLRPIAMLSLIAALDRAAGTPTSKALRLLRFRLSGR